MMSNRSPGKWEAHKNSSWGANHVAEFGSRAAYVICYHNRNRELVTLASVIGQPFVLQNEIDANAKLIAAAPELLRALERFTILDESQYKDIAGFIQESKKVVHSILTP